MLRTILTPGGFGQAKPMSGLGMTMPERYIIGVVIIGTWPW